jgi:hypothetical protein
VSGKGLQNERRSTKLNQLPPRTTVIPTVAGLEQQIRSAISAFYKERGFSNASHEADSALPKGVGHTAFGPILPLDQSGNGWSGQGISEAIKQLANLQSSAKDDISKQSIVALQAYALFATGQDESAIEMMHEVRFLEEVDMNNLKSGRYNEDYTIALIMMGYTIYGECEHPLSILAVPSMRY